MNQLSQDPESETDSGKLLHHWGACVLLRCDSLNSMGFSRGSSWTLIELGSTELQVGSLQTEPPQWKTLSCKYLLERPTSGKECVNLFRQRGKVPWGKPLCITLITKVTKKKKVKVKETDLWVRIGSFLQQFPNCGAGGSMVKNLPANAGDSEMQFVSQYWEDPLE